MLPSLADRLTFEKPGVKHVTPGKRGALTTDEIESRLTSKFPGLAFPFVVQDHLHGVNSDVHLLCKKHGLISRVGLPGMLYGNTTYGCTQCAAEAGAVHRAAHPKHYTPNAMSRRGLQSGIFIEVKKEYPDAVWEATLPDGKELDIYVPSLKLGIELNGNYWHSTAVKADTNYHLKKTISAARCDISVVHVWEDMAVPPFTNIMNILRLASNQCRLRVKPKDRIEEVNAEQAEEFHLAWNCRPPIACRRAQLHVGYVRKGTLRAVLSVDTLHGLIVAASTCSLDLSLNWFAKYVAKQLDWPYIKLLADALTPIEVSWAQQDMTRLKELPPVALDLDAGNKLCVLSGKPASGNQVWDSGYVLFTSK